MLTCSREFVKNEGYKEYITNKYPDKEIVTLSCTGTHLTALPPAILGIRNGDVKMIKNAGGVTSHPFGSVTRSLPVAIFKLGVEEIIVIAHSGCGACHMYNGEMLEKMKARGINAGYIHMMSFCGVDFHSWLDDFEDTEKSVKGTVDFTVHHPLIPSDVKMHGFIIDSTIGELTRIVQEIILSVYQGLHKTWCHYRNRVVSLSLSHGVTMSSGYRHYPK